MPVISTNAASAIRDILLGETQLDYRHNNIASPEIQIYPRLQERIDDFAEACVHLDAAQSKRLSNLLTAYANVDEDSWPANRQNALKSFYIANLPATASTALFP